jgi:hypothetical protein
VILLNQVIQVLAGPDERLSGQDAISLQFGDGFMGRPTAVECDLLRDIIITDRLLEEAYGGRLIPVLSQQEIDCLTLLIDRAVEIAPLTIHFDIGFINSPGRADGARVVLPLFLKGGDEAYVISGFSKLLKLKAEEDLAKDRYIQWLRTLRNQGTERIHKDRKAGRQTTLAGFFHMKESWRGGKGSAECSQLAEISILSFAKTQFIRVFNNFACLSPNQNIRDQKFDPSIG